LFEVDAQADPRDGNGMQCLIPFLREPWLQLSPETFPFEIESQHCFFDCRYGEQIPTTPCWRNACLIKLWIWTNIL